MGIMQKIEKDHIRTDLPEFGPGDTVHIKVKITEGAKDRLQPFEGVVIRKRSSGSRGTFTVRKVSYGIGVERIFPINSPTIHSMKVLRRAKIRRAKLYYLRDLKGKAARLKERR